jgi:hypothetical protein
LRRVSWAGSEADSCAGQARRGPGQKSTITRHHPHQTPSSSPAAGVAHGRSARTGGERETTKSTAAGKRGKRTRSGPGSMDTRATTTGGKAHTAAAPQRRTRQHGGAIDEFVRWLEGRLQRMPGQRTSRWAKGMADMWMCVDGRWRANRQGM